MTDAASLSADPRTGANADQMTPPQSAYIHVPFCAHKCGYCDFASVAGQDDLRDDYLAALDAEMAAILPGPQSVQTIFVGGGTPTYLSPVQLARLLDRLNYWFGLATVDEFTVEANPNTLTAEKVAVLADHGVNRVSLGAQSFQPHLLRVLERDHDPASVPRAVELVRRRIDNVSLDLIFGVPGQRFEEWVEDLERVLALEPAHCSTYGLTYEKGTRLYSQRKLGQLQPIDEELERQLYEHAIDRLAAAGFAHYEISNFGQRPGGVPAAQVCRHNLTYWANEPCFGFGTGAAAYRNGTRTLNTRELAAYINRCRNGRSPVTQTETLEPEERARETAMLNLRRLAGIDRDEFYGRTGFALDALAGKEMARFVALGLLADDGRTVRLTRAGLMLADSVLQSLL